MEDQLIVALRRITRSIDLHSHDLLQAAGLTAPQLATLQAISRLQPVPLGTLAKTIHLSQATLTGILTRLENRNYIARSRCGADRRSVRVELTELASSLLENAPSLLQHSFRERFFELPEWEQTQMLATLQRIASMMESPPTEVPSLQSASVQAAFSHTAELAVEARSLPPEEFEALGM